MGKPERVSVRGRTRIKRCEMDLASAERGRANQADERLGDREFKRRYFLHGDAIMTGTPDSRNLRRQPKITLPPAVSNALSIRVSLLSRSSEGYATSFLLARSPSARENARIGFRVRRAFANDPRQMSIQRVLRIRPIETVIPIAATDDQIRTFQLGQFILHGSQREEA